MKLDNPQAFPAQFDFTQQDDLSRQEGMTLRDYFANTAMLGMIITPHKIDNGEFDKEKVAIYAYSFADAMLVERSKSND